MISLDANLLIYVVNADAPNHFRVKSRVDETLAGRHGSVGLAWITVVAFVRIITMPKLMAKPRTLIEALTEIEQWLALPDVSLINPGGDHFAHFEAMCRSVQVTGNLITDAELTALAIRWHDCKMPGIVTAVLPN